jgi:hypothetical protein
MMTTARSLRFIPLLGIVLFVFAFAPCQAFGQAPGSPVSQTGTVLAYEGWESQQAPCALDHYYEQFSRFSGRVILPETEAKVYDFIESWGRDSGTQVMRFSPNGDVYSYYMGVEQKFSTRAPAGTYWEFTDPDSGNVLRHQIVREGITLTLPTGVVYENVSRMNVYCTNCGPEWVLLESYWLSSELQGYPVLLMVWNAQSQCADRWLWFVSMRKKQEGS